MNAAKKETGKDIKSWDDAIVKIEKAYGKIISSYEDWKIFSKN